MMSYLYLNGYDTSNVDHFQVVKGLPLQINKLKLIFQFFLDYVDSVFLLLSFVDIESLFVNPDLNKSQ